MKRCEGRSKKSAAGRSVNVAEHGSDYCWECKRLAAEQPHRVSLLASQRVLVSSREALRSSTRFSSGPCESRTKATSGESLGSKPRGSLGEHSPQFRRTRMSVFPQTPSVTSHHGLGSPPIRKRKQNFDFIGMNAPLYYETLQHEFTRLHGLGWTFRQIAEALKISERTVTAWREELDLPRRPRGRRPRKSRR